MKARASLVIYAALLADVIIVVAKLAAAMKTGSSAMLAEFFHSLADSSNEGMLLLSLMLSRRPADEQHPFGYGKERFFWAFVVAILILAMGAGLSISDGVERVRNPEAIQFVHWTYIVLGAAFFADGISFAVSSREFQRLRQGRTWGQALRDMRDPAVITVMFADGAALIGVAIAVTGITLAQWTGLYAFDGVASILIGILLAGIALLIARETRDLLIGEAAPLRVRRRIRDTVRTFPEVERVHDILTMHLGPDEILLNANIQFRDELKTTDLEILIDRIETALKKVEPRLARIFIEVDTPELHGATGARSRGGAASATAPGDSSPPPDSTQPPVS